MIALGVCIVVDIYKLIDRDFDHEMLENGASFG